MSNSQSRGSKGNISPGKNSWAQPFFGEAPPVAVSEQWPGATPTVAPFLVGEDMAMYQASLNAGEASVNLPHGEASSSLTDQTKPLPEAPSMLFEARRGFKKLFSRKDNARSVSPDKKIRPALKGKARSEDPLVMEHPVTRSDHHKGQLSFGSPVKAPFTADTQVQHRSRSEGPHGRNDAIIFSRQASLSPTRMGTYSRRRGVEIDTHPAIRVPSQYGVVEQASTPSTYRPGCSSVQESQGRPESLKVTNVWAHDPLVGITIPPFSATTQPSPSSENSAGIYTWRNNNSFAVEHDQDQSASRVDTPKGDYPAIPKSFQDFTPSEQLDPKFAALEQRVHSHIDQAVSRSIAQTQARSNDVEESLRKMNAEICANFERMWMRMKYLERDVESRDTKLAGDIDAKYNDLSARIGRVDLETELHHLRMFQGRFRTLVEAQFKKIESDFEVLRNEVTAATVDAVMDVVDSQMAGVKEEIGRTIKETIESVITANSGPKSMDMAADANPMNASTAVGAALTTPPRQRYNFTDGDHNQERVNSTGTVEGRAGSAVLTREEKGGPQLRRTRSAFDQRMQLRALSRARAREDQEAQSSRSIGLGHHSQATEREGPSVMPLVVGPNGLAYEGPSEELLGFQESQ